MLLRYLILRLCKSRAEIRIVLREVITHHIQLIEFNQGMTHVHRQPDKRITRSVRLSMLCGLLMLHVESPHLFSSALMVVPLATLLLLFRIVGVLR